MWHASAASTSLALGANTLRGYARKALEGVGDGVLGQWEEFGVTAFHLRRRLSEREAARVGPVVDIRGTAEAERRLAYVRTRVPGWTE